MSDQRAYDGYHGSAQWDAAHCPECGAERVEDCCSDADDLERHIAHRVRLRREAREDARAYRACGLGRTSWIIAALCARREYAVELSDREIDAVACVTWGALGDRHHHEEAA